MRVSTELAHSVAEIVRQLMIQEGQAGDPEVLGSDNLPTADWPAYKGVEPHAPGDCITVFTTAGIDGGRTMIDGENASFFGIQVRFRADDDVAGVAKAAAVRKWMEALYFKQITIDSTDYVVPSFCGIGQVNELSRDRPPTGRFVCTLNAMTAIRVVVSR